MTKTKPYWCGHTICHFPCDNENTKLMIKRRQTCPCKYCKLNRRIMGKETKS